MCNGEFFRIASAVVCIQKLVISGVLVVNRLFLKTKRYFPKRLHNPLRPFMYNCSLEIIHHLSLCKFVSCLSTHPPVAAAKRTQPPRVGPSEPLTTPISITLNMIYQECMINDIIMHSWIGTGDVYTQWWYMYM